MTAPLRSAIRQHVGPLRWRDRKIAEQQRQLKQRGKQINRLRQRVRRLESQLRDLREEDVARPESQRSADLQEKTLDSEPSFRREILSLRTQLRAARGQDPDSRTALRQIPHKLRNYRLAASHGIRTPNILGLWPDADSIDLTGLPEQFVLKSDGGAGGQGVFPLHRTASDEFTIAGSDRTYTQRELIDSIKSLRRRARPPFFAEEYLVTKQQEGPIPEDVKIYAFYGEVGQILLRSVSEHGSHGATRYRFIWPDGSDLGKVSFDKKAPPIDPTVPIPPDLRAMVGVARHLSLCLGTPFIRVDVYDTPGRPTLGELTRVPGGEHRYRTSHDQEMGAMWLRARTRLEHDIMTGRPPGTIYGEEPAVDFYDQIDRVDAGPGSWPVTIRPCAQWCERTTD